MASKKNKNPKWVLPKLMVFYVLLIFPSQLAFGQKTITNEEFKKDLASAKKNIEKYHLGLYYYESQQDFDSRYEAIIENLPEKLSILEAYRLTNEFTSGMRDLHTSTILPKNFIEKKDRKSLPLTIRKVGEKFYIHFNMSSDSSLIRGSEVISIDGVSINKDFESFQNLWGTDNGNETSKKYYSERLFARNYNYIYGIKDSVNVAFKKPQNDSVFVKKIAFETPKEATKILNQRYKNVSRKNLNFKILDSLNHIAYLDVLSFKEKGNKFDFPQHRFKKLLKKHFKAIEKNEIEHLIVDFRFNGGGLINNISRITKYIAPEPFEIIDNTYIKKASFLKIFPPYFVLPYIAGRFIFKKLDDDTFIRVGSKKRMTKLAKKYHYDKKIYVLMDGGSYSATTFTIGLWKDMNRATFIGMQPGGANWGSFAGQWKDIKLPNSKLKVHIPLMKIIHAQPNKTTQTFFVEPDYYVEQSFDDFIKRKDAQLNFALDLIKNK